MPFPLSIHLPSLPGEEGGEVMDEQCCSPGQCRALSTEPLWGTLGLGGWGAARHHSGTGLPGLYVDAASLALSGLAGTRGQVAPRGCGELQEGWIPRPLPQAYVPALLALISWF